MTTQIKTKTFRVLKNGIDAGTITRSICCKLKPGEAFPIPQSFEMINKSSETVYMTFEPII